MAGILWRDVNAPQFADALQGFSRSGEAITAALAAARTGLKDWRDNQTREASADLMSDLMTQYTGDPRGLQRDLADGTFMRGRDTRLLSETALAAIGARQQDLQNFETGTQNTILARHNAAGRGQQVDHEMNVQTAWKEDRDGTTGIRGLFGRLATMNRDQRMAALREPANLELMSAAPREELTALLRLNPELEQLFGNVDLTGAQTRLTGNQATTESFRPAQVQAQTGLTNAQTGQTNATTAQIQETTRGLRFDNDVKAEDRTNTTNALGAINNLMREGDISGARRYIEENWGSWNDRVRALIIQNGGAAYQGLFGQVTLPDGSRPMTDPAPTAPPPVAVPGAPAPAGAPASGRDAPWPTPWIPSDGRGSGGGVRPRPASSETGFLPEARVAEGQPDVAALLQSAVANGGPVGADPGFRPAAATFGFDDEDDSAGQMIKASLSGSNGSKGGGQRRPSYPNSAPADRDHSRVPFSAVRDRIQGGESANHGGYNALAYNTRGGRGNSAGVRAPRPLTSMTMGEVYDFQRGPMRQRTRGFRGRGDPGSTGAGAYQFESGTLRENAAIAFGPNWRNMPFSPANQDRVAETLYNRVRGNRAALGATWAAFAGGGRRGGQSAEGGAPSPYGDLLAEAAPTSGQLAPMELVGGEDAARAEQMARTMDPAQQLLAIAQAQRENPINPVAVAPVELSRLPSTNVAALIAAAAAARRPV